MLSELEGLAKTSGTSPSAPVVGVNEEKLTDERLTK